MIKIHGNGRFFFNHRLAQFGGKLVFWGNLSPKDVRLLNLRDPFLAEIMEYWTTLNYKDNNLDFTSAQIWHNSLIRIENKPIFYKSWFTAGVKDVKDILDTDGNAILSYTTFTSKCKIKTNFLEFYKVVSETHKGLKRVTLICLFCPMLVIIHFRKYHIWNEKKSQLTNQTS